MGYGKIPYNWEELINSIGVNRMDWEIKGIQIYIYIYICI